MKFALLFAVGVAGVMAGLQVLVAQSIPVTTRQVATAPTATTRLTTQAGTAPTSRPASQPTSWPTSAPAARVVKLVADLDAQDWDQAERAVLELSHYDRQTEDAIKRAMEGAVSDRFKERAARVLEAIYTARIKVGGTWEEQLWADVRRTQLVRITADAKGVISMAPAPAAHYQQYEYSNARFDGKTLKFHVKTNPNFEFDVEVKLDDKGDLVGKRTRSNDGESYDFTMKRVGD